MTSFRPSNLARRIACAGSRQMEEGLPDVATTDSDLGTMLHDLLAHPEKPREHLPEDQVQMLDDAERMEQELVKFVEGQL